MAQATKPSPTPKLALSASRDIPFNKLRLSQANVRHVQAGLSIEELAEDIAQRSLLQSLSVRPILDDEGQETGTYEVPAGGRRFRALELLVKQKRLAKTAPIPCVVRTAGIAEEDSLAENVQRVALHPLDQFRAFRTLREGHGLGDEEIAARFFVTPQVVRQRLRLASASPKLLEVYEAGGLTLEQLMAFTVTADHARQERAWEALARSYTREPYHIRRLLTEGAVRAADRRALFVGIEAYEANGGVVLRDLFGGDDGGWLQDPALLNRLASEKLGQEAGRVRQEGWRWVEAAADFPYGHTYGLRRLHSTEPALTDAERSRIEALQAEYEGLEASHAGPENLPEAVDARLGEIEVELEGLRDRAPQFDPAEVACAGTFVSLGADGRVRVERGYVRREDEPTVEAPPAPDAAEGVSSHPSTGPLPDAGGTVPQVHPEAGSTPAGAPEPACPAPEPAEEDEGVRPLSERLLTELSVHRTVALRDALAGNPHVAFLSALHALVLRLFYPFGGDGSCLELDPRSAAFTVQAPRLADTPSARAISARHQAWAGRLPREPEALWDALGGLDGGDRMGLFAHCVGLIANAVQEPWPRRPRAIAHAGVLARAVGLDMAAAGWAPTVENYLGRVTKGRILEAVREAKGDQAAQLIDHLRKADMAREAERLLEGTGWVPEQLRTPTEEGGVQPTPAVTESGEPEGLPAFLEGEDEAVSHLVAAE